MYSTQLTDDTDNYYTCLLLGFDLLFYTAIVVTITITRYIVIMV